jgi:hypothetical protein
MVSVKILKYSICHPDPLCLTRQSQGTMSVNPTPFYPFPSQYIESGRQCFYKPKEIRRRICYVTAWGLETRRTTCSVKENRGGNLEYVK